MGADMQSVAGSVEMSHTPGPWRVFHHSWCDTTVCAEGFDHGICSLDINHATEESQEKDGDVMAANARLISAAPDLLEALQLYSLPIHGDSREARAEFGDMAVEREMKARAAIAKATTKDAT